MHQHHLPRSEKFSPGEVYCSTSLSRVHVLPPLYPTPHHNTTNSPSLASARAATTFPSPDVTAGHKHLRSKLNQPQSLAFTPGSSQAIVASTSNNNGGSSDYHTSMPWISPPLYIMVCSCQPHYLTHCPSIAVPKYLRQPRFPHCAWPRCSMKLLS